MRAAYLNEGYIAIVDDEDWDLIADRTWAVARQPSGTPYAVTSRQVNPGFWTKISMHRLIMSVTDDRIIDHINGYGLDNRRDNLRIANAHMNAANRIFHRTGKKRGAYKVGNRWQAKIRGRHIGMFATQEEAWRAYDEEAKKLYGKSVVLNYP